MSEAQAAEIIRLLRVQALFQMYLVLNQSGVCWSQRDVDKLHKELKGLDGALTP